MSGMMVNYICGQISPDSSGLKYKSYENKNNFPICFLSVFINIVFLQ